MPTKRKDGRYQSSVTVENPITGEKTRQYFYGYTLQELEAERRRILNMNVSDFLLVETFHRFTDDFLTMKRDIDKLEASTIATYRGFLARHILPSIPPNMKIADVKPALLKHILAHVEGDRTRQAVYTLLMSIFKAAKFEQLVENNPMEFIRKPKHTAASAGIVTPEIYHALLMQIRGTQIEHLFKFAWDTGLRRGEIVALRWSDFEADSALVHVSKARKRAAEEYEGATKTAYSDRIVTMSPAAVQNLLTWKKRLATRLLEQGIRLTKDDYIFRSLKDETQPMTLTAATHIFADLKKKLNLPQNLRFHSFRHTHATLLAEQEVSAKKIQVRLGHASASFTMDRYVHNTEKMQAGITEKVVKCEETYGR
ncbi:tyrosine-type recombinase/integrase [Selenomonas artemidis]|uniref:tyrosine-type recombinase/integrase n=1 Tax=Selenomonas artemidis TaxID=671224 RepID=UPI00288BC351|nr:tyrosine-type recombinase/integrase [Selenomonas artemidis]